jgi:hypothetical protein
MAANSLCPADSFAAEAAPTKTIVLSVGVAPVRFIFRFVSITMIVRWAFFASLCRPTAYL